MISYEEAQELTFKEAKVLEKVKVNLADAFGRVLSADIVAPHSLPSFNNSAMDGYALRSEDTEDGSKVVLELISEEAAGNFQHLPVNKGQAAMIMTGAPIPPGADAVIPREEVEESPTQIVISRKVKQGENVRFQGEDVKEGETVLERGTLINSPTVGLLAALGFYQVEVYRQPVVGVLATGSELLEVDQPLKPGFIRNSNTYALQAQIASAGANFVNLGVVSDKLEEMVTTLERALSQCDVILTTGGVSMGNYDLVKEAFEKLEARKVFWKVAQKPAKPLAFYVFERGDNRNYLFGLPGNPGAVAISFEEYVRPFLKLLSGRNDYRAVEIEAKMKHEVKKKRGRLNFLRVKLTYKDGEYLAESVGLQGSGILKTLTRTTGLALIPAEVDYVSAGEKVRVHLVEW